MLGGDYQIPGGTRCGFCEEAGPRSENPSVSGSFPDLSGCYTFDMIPLPLRAFFWDIDTESFDPHSHPDYAIERILELGNTEAVRWLQAEFSEEEIRRVIREARRLTEIGDVRGPVLSHSSQ